MVDYERNKYLYRVRGTLFRLNIANDVNVIYKAVLLSADMIFTWHILNTPDSVNNQYCAYGKVFCLYMLEFYGPVSNEVMSSRSINRGTVPEQA